VEEDPCRLGLQALTAHIRFFVSGVFEWALNHGMYSGFNPAAADLPEGLPKGKETSPYSVEEIGRMLSLLADANAQAVVAMAFGSGLRKGELAGFRWEDYEKTDNGAVIHVRQAVWHRRITTVKTESSVADVNLGVEFCEYIDAYRRLCRGINSGLMFGYSADRPVNLDSFANEHLCSAGTGCNDLGRRPDCFTQQIQLVVECSASVQQEEIPKRLHGNAIR
jgi:integrase